MEKSPMKPSPQTRYQPTDNGYQITASREIFNRTLYGGHANDDLQERFFTLAGDTPLIMGTVTDWSKHTACHYAKCGVLMSGLALTPGVKVSHFYSADVDNSSQWFHDALDTVAVFRNGWMDYQIQQFSPWFPDAKVAMSVFPLMPEDGFLVHYRITADQRVIFCAGFGGITDFMGRFEYAGVKDRTFHADDCQDNTVLCKKNRALIKGKRKDAMWIGASFPVQVESGSAASLEKDAPGMFLASQNTDAVPPAVKLFTPINPGQTLDGFIVVLRNQDEGVLDRWLRHKDPVAFLKQQIRLKHAALTIHTPDAMFNLTVGPTVLAMDASWHKHTFYHGAHGYHCPFLGWRNWYGPTVIGWHDRVKGDQFPFFRHSPKSSRQGGRLV